MFGKLIKVTATALLAIALVVVAGPQAEAQHYHGHRGHYGHGHRVHQVHRAAHYGGGAWNTYSRYRPAVSVGFSTRPAISYYSGRPAYGYSRPVYARPVYYGNNFGGGFYGGYPRYYGNRGGISIGIRF